MPAVTAVSRVDVKLLAAEIGRRLRTHRSVLTQESKLQAAIAAALREMNVEHEREYLLTPQCRLDFRLADGVCIEVKKQKAGLEALRQIGRYLEHADISGCILIAMRVDPVIPSIYLGKPIERIELWKMLL